MGATAPCRIASHSATAYNESAGQGHDAVVAFFVSAAQAGALAAEQTLLCKRPLC